MKPYTIFQTKLCRSLLFESDINQVQKPRYDNGKVFINDTHYFEEMPQRAWEFYIGGYQPAQKWLKDRKGRTLSFEDVLHY